MKRMEDWMTQSKWSVRTHTPRLKDNRESEHAKALAIRANKAKLHLEQEKPPNNILVRWEQKVLNTPPTGFALHYIACSVRQDSSA